MRELNFGTMRSDEGELSRLVAGFTARAHLASDLASPAPQVPLARYAAVTPRDAVDKIQREEAELATETRATDEDYEGMPLGTAIVMAVAAMAVGVAFQNQRAWADMTSARYSRGMYAQLM